ncbi:hypothetical protein OA491_00210 [Alphaproteobacteria bacterium]|nr:hypothetical protein [Alphaproteobacteria bacterium]
MNETVVSFCECLKSSIISVKINILYLWKLVDEIINNSRTNPIFISTGLFNTLENPAKENIKFNNF